jgi:hypothetical protein
LTRLSAESQLLPTPKTAQGHSMPKPTNSQFKTYANYAAHCLQMVAATKVQEERCIMREMAVEWIRLADDLLDPRKRKAYKVGVKAAAD